MTDATALTMDSNLADLCAAVAAATPDRCALVCDGQRLSYAELTARSEQVAQHLIAAGVRPDETVGLYLPNSAAYAEAMLGCMVARAIPVNINYRYTGPELAHLFGNANLAALIVDAQYAELAAEVAPSCPGLRHVLVVGGDHGGPGSAAFPGSVTVTDYHTAVDAMPAVRPDLDRSGDDKLIIYTGGTTGLPKGVLWRHEDFFVSALAGGNHYGEPRRSVEEVVAAAVQTPEMGYLLAVPLMHGSGTYTIFTAFLMASKVVITRKFDAAKVVRLMQTEQIALVAVVGDAMARPIADEIAAHPDQYDLSAWLVLGSGGALLSQSVREQLVSVRPGLFVTDRFGSSETGTDGQIERDQGGQPRLIAPWNVRVLGDDLRPAGPGEIGRIAKSGHVPLGYYGDEAATAATFPVIDGERWALLGDLALVEDDGSIVVLGRGATCINTGGEKVFPEEVEQALKSHPAVLDVLVVGVPDTRYGERVAAVVQRRAGAEAADAEVLREHCRASVAGYKVPARVEFVPEVARSPSGKPDYRWARGVLAGNAVCSPET
ncbi:MAG TPA: AMP-binding protein [Streptosporangiaceae bacterium]|nr:AMP-binding protein [Streptosporangiaceae bacterium]